MCEVTELWIGNVSIEKCVKWNVSNGNVSNESN